MAILSDYTTGTVTIAANATAVTGIGTAWNLTELQEGDELLVNNLVGIIQSVNGPTSITLTRPWTGAAVTSVPYRARYQPDGSRFSNISKELLEVLNNSANFAAFAELSGVAGAFPYFTGSGTMTLAPSGTKGRDILSSTDMVNLLAKLGPVNGGGVNPTPAAAQVSMVDGDFNTITVPGTYNITGNWTNGFLGAASAAYTGWLIVRNRGHVEQEFHQSNNTSPIRYARFAPNTGTSWPNPWFNLTSLGYAGGPEIVDASLPDRLKINNVAVDIVDCNNIISNGFYRINTNTLNSPFAAPGMLITSARASNGNGVAQIAIRADNGFMFVRTLNGGIWKAWDKSLAVTDILTTVSQSGGVPTGGIMDYGSNANGNYLRFANGLQVCIGNISLNADTAQGSIFAGTDTPWNLPATFVSTNFSVIYSPQTGQRWGSARPTSATQAYVRQWCYSLSTGIIVGTATAIGRWF